MTPITAISHDHNIVSVFCCGPTLSAVTDAEWDALKAHTYTVAINQAFINSPRSPHLRCITDRNAFQTIIEGCKQDTLAGYAGNVEGRWLGMPENHFSHYFQKHRGEPYATLLMVLRALAGAWKDKQFWLIGVDFEPGDYKHYSVPAGHEKEKPWFNDAWEVWLKQMPIDVENLFKADPTLYDRCLNGNPRTGLSFMKIIDWRKQLKSEAA
jgi:hypothetical protein